MDNQIIEIKKYNKYNEYYRRHREEVLKNNSKFVECQICKIKHKIYNTTSHRRGKYHLLAKRLLDEIVKLKIANIIKE